MASDPAKEAQVMLVDAGLLEPRSSLKHKLKAAYDYVRRWFHPDSIEGGMAIDPTTGAPTGFTGKITFAEPTAQGRTRGLRSADVDDAPEALVLTVMAAPRKPIVRKARRHKAPPEEVVIGERNDWCARRAGLLIMQHPIRPAKAIYDRDVKELPTQDFTREEGRDGKLPTLPGRPPDYASQTHNIGAGFAVARESLLPPTSRRDLELHGVSPGPRRSTVAFGLGREMCILWG